MLTNVKIYIMVINFLYFKSLGMAFGYFKTRIYKEALKDNRTTFDDIWPIYANWRTNHFFPNKFDYLDHNFIPDPENLESSRKPCKNSLRPEKSPHKR